jgi:hypothetical protein
MAHDVREKVVARKIVFSVSLQLLSETFLVLRIQRNIIINLRRFSCKVPLVLSDCSQTLMFSTDVRKILEYQTL